MPGHGNRMMVKLVRKTQSGNPLYRIRGWVKTVDLNSKCPDKIEVKFYVGSETQ